MWDEGKRKALTKSLNNNNKYMVHTAPLERAKDIANFCIKT
jgi:hypothetical protein